MRQNYTYDKNLVWQAMYDDVDDVFSMTSWIEEIVTSPERFKISRWKFARWCVVRCATLNLTEDELEIAFLEISDGGRPPC